MYDSKNLAIGLIAVCLLLLSFQSMQAQHGSSGTDDPMLGPIQIDQLFDLEGWFGGDFINYVPERRYTNKLKTYLDGVTILCFLGTWCEDSELHVPRMLKILQQAGIDPEQFQMFGLDESFHSPAGDEMPYNIEKAPTFVFIHKGGEIGRITEEPIGTLERDMIAIIRKSFPEEFPMPTQPAPAMEMNMDIGPVDGADPAMGEVPPEDGSDPARR